MFWVFLLSCESIRCGRGTVEVDGVCVPAASARLPIEPPTEHTGVESDADTDADSDTDTDADTDPDVSGTGDTGPACGDGGTLGWQTADWHSAIDVRLGYSAWSIGLLEVPFAETGDLCSARCSVIWAAPFVSRPGEGCDPTRAATLPLLDVVDGAIISACVVVYEPSTTPAETTCTWEGTGGPFVVTLTYR